MTLDEFVAAWHCLVGEWHAARLDPDGKPARVLRRALRHGLTSPTSDDHDRLARPEAGTPGMSRRCELAVLRLSGALRPKAYTKANRDVAKKGLDPFEHFVDQGWRRLRNPSREFDVWWYWSEYLDPSRDSVNPLLHYLLVGRHVGHEPVPPVELPSSPTSFREGSRPRRICLFAGYDPHGVVDDYVVAYVKELSRSADVYYLADGYMQPGELDKLHDIAKGAWARSHGAYDFGSYSMLARELVGWDVIDDYDELLLVNDSGFLLRPLEPVFREMDMRTCDWWGLQATRHDFDRHSNGGKPLPLGLAKSTMIGERTMEDMDHLHVSSYFLAFRHRAHSDPGFRKRLDNVTRQEDKHLVIYKYEIGLSRYLMCRGYEVDTFIPDLYPFHPLYTEQYFDLLRLGFPLLKRNFLSENSRDVPDLVRWKDLIVAEVPDAPLEILERNLERVSPDDRLRRSFSLVADEDGDLPETRPHGWWQTIDLDRVAPTFDHWWGFPVDVTTGHLSSDQRAVFEAVRHDPAVRKVVLTRAERVDLDGENVEVLPLQTHQGQEAALRCRTFFVSQSPRVSVPFPLSPARHRFVLVGSAWRLERPARPVAERDETPDQDAQRLAYIVAASHADMPTAGAYAGVTDPSRILVTGPPRLDLLRRSSVRLPVDLREQEEQATKAADGRPLLLFAPHRAAGWADPEAAVSAAGLERLLAACHRAGIVLGYQDRAGDRHMRLSQVLQPSGALRFDRREFPHPEPLVRAADLVVTDGADVALDAAAVGRPVVLVPPQAARDVFLVPPRSSLEGAGCRVVPSLEEFAQSLGGIMDELQQRSPSMVQPTRVDDDSAGRLARAVRRLDAEGAEDAEDGVVPV